MTAPSGWPVPTPQELADWKDRHWPVPPVQDPVRNPWLQPLKAASVRVQQEKARAA